MKFDFSTIYFFLNQFFLLILKQETEIFCVILIYVFILVILKDLISNVNKRFKLYFFERFHYG
jgi:hypothetical protein